ncbi:Clavaminate synthase-like protein [Haematococcus lacustris]
MPALPPSDVPVSATPSDVPPPAQKQPDLEKPRLHPGPNGTWLRGYAVRELNDFHYAVAREVKIPAVDPAAVQATRVTQQGVDVEPGTIVSGPNDWRAADFRGAENEHKWQLVLQEQDLQEIDSALASLESRGVRIEDMTVEDFPLPTLGPKLVHVRDEVILGKGFHLIRNFPVQRLSRWQTVAAYHGFGLYWGKPQAQNAKGHLVGHIKAIGTDPGLEGVRPYTTSIPHGYHTDNSDIAALLCLHDAEEGGVNNWVSSIAVHNALLRRGRKDLVEVLTNGDYWLPAHNVWGSPSDRWDASGSHPGPTWVSTPPFLYHNNRLSVTYKEGAYYYYYKFPDAPRFTPLQEEALRTFTALAMSDELRLDHKLAPGDISLVNNLTMLHAKTAFKDSADPAKRRHLLRLWVAAPNAPPLPSDSAFAPTWGSVEVGDRGGYWLGHKYVKHVPLDAEYGDLEETRPKQAQQQ